MCRRENFILLSCSEEVGQPLQSVLLIYLRVILTEWEEPYMERAVQVMSALTNKNLIRDLFVSLLQSKVSGAKRKKGHKGKVFVIVKKI